jgi:hypothetical protein
MKNVPQIIANLRKAVNSSKPNVRYKQIMEYIDALEAELTVVDEVVSEDLLIEVEEVNDEIVEILEDEVEEVMEMDVELTSLNLTELRALYPDIKASSKEKFLEQINNQ